MMGCGDVVMWLAAVTRWGRTQGAETGVEEEES